MRNYIMHHYVSIIGGDSLTIEVLLELFRQ